MSCDFEKINVWSYNKLSLQALKSKWKEEWGDFYYLLHKGKIKREFYIDLNRYSDAQRIEFINALKSTSIKN